MFMQLFRRLFPSKIDHHSEDKIATLKEAVELKTLVQAQNQRSEVTTGDDATSNDKFVASARTAYYDWEDSSWDNCRSGECKVAVTVTQYNQDGNIIAREVFCAVHLDKGTQIELLEEAWNEVWKKADEYAESLKKSGIPIRNEIRNGIMRRYSVEKVEIPLELREETAQYNTVQNQPLGPFFPKDGPVLVHSLGTWEQDVAEAQRRMDMFFSTAEAFKFARRRATVTECNGSFRTIGVYDYTFWSREYFHSHDGWDIEGESASVIRISPKEFHNPSDPHHAKERILAMNGEQNKSVRLSAWGQTTYDQLWNVPGELQTQEDERYYLSYNKFRAKNFLGMVGYFEIRKDSF